MPLLVTSRLQRSFRSALTGRLIAPTSWKCECFTIREHSSKWRHYNRYPMGQISSRQAFRQRLDQASAALSEQIRKTPRFGPYASVKEQLDSLEHWTAGGREPAAEERARINMGLIVIREFDPEPDDELYGLMQDLHQIQAYVDVWPPEGEAPFK
jgi:hypothetical protein